MKVRDIMTSDVASAEPDTTLEEIATMMKNEDVGAIPVVDGGELTAIITDRDIVVRCIAEGKDPSETTAEDIGSEELRTVEPDADVEEAARIMAEHQIRRLPVVEDGELVGMVALGDIAVKHGDEETSGATLEDVSEGVKGGRGASRARKQPAGKRAAQGVSNRSAERESSRQQKVNPARAQGSAKRRRAG